MTLQLLYFAQDENRAHGRGKGWVVSISSRWEVGRKARSPRMGRTKIPRNPGLVERLLSGAITVDVDRTTEETPVFKNDPMPIRQIATQIVGLPPGEWEGSPYCQPVGKPRVYEDYALEFLNEYAKRTKAISAHSEDSFVELNTAEVLVGRDGTAIVFGTARRAMAVTVTIERSRIVDELLLPHPPGRGYAFHAPNSVDTWICDDRHFYLVRGNGYIHESTWGNPHKVILERRSHGFLENILLKRVYPDGYAVSRRVDLLELLGSTDPNSFTAAMARARALAYVERLAVANIIRDPEANSPVAIKGIAALRDHVSSLRELVYKDGTQESVLEAFLDQNPWMIERGLSYKRYHSQVSIPQEMLSRTDKNIKPDKLLERSDGYCDVLDLKRADVRLLVGKENRVSPCRTPH